MKLLDKLKERWSGLDYPFLIHPNGSLRFSQITALDAVNLYDIKSGDVVALVGDFDPQSILILLELIDKNAILVPLTKDTRSQHDYFFEAALVDVVIDGSSVRRIKHDLKNKFIDELRLKEHAGLVLFSTGTTGRTKAILHDLTLFMERFETPRPTLKTINFLLFDHIGGLNTLLHTLFNKGTVVAPKSRSVEDILATCAEHMIEVLPTTPTFLRMMLMSGLIPEKVPNSLRNFTYGTELMDQPTLDSLCELLPIVEFRQTFGMSELGIVRVKSEARNSLFMKVGGEGVKTRVVDGVLQIWSSSRMIGYLNASSPFDADGWYDTKDVVEVKGDFYKVTGRINDVINVGGLKFMSSEVELVALTFPNVSLVKVISRQNPITGQHVELLIQPNYKCSIDKKELMNFLQKKLLPHMVPKRISVEDVTVGHRFKKI